MTAPSAGKLVDKYPREMAIRLSSIFVIISMLTYSFTENVILIVIVFTIPIYMTFFIGARAIVADTVPYELRARTMGLLSSFSLLGGGVGSISVGEILLTIMNKRLSCSSIFSIHSFSSFLKRF